MKRRISSSSVKIRAPCTAMLNCPWDTLGAPDDKDDDDEEAADADDASAARATASASSSAAADGRPALVFLP
jgi:hypothetical protein